MTQYDVDKVKNIEKAIGMQLDTLEMDEKKVLQVYSTNEMKEGLDLGFGDKNVVCGTADVIVMALTCMYSNITILFILFLYCVLGNHTCLQSSSGCISLYGRASS